MNKQEHVVTVDVGGTPLTLKTGWMAKQANGAVTCQYGDTVVFTAVVSDAKGREGLDFFPLTVDYREKTYAAGKIPGGFFKREARPSEKEILTCRLIDRPIRPCFPEGYKNETQVQAMVWSHDQEHDPDTIAIVASTAALAVSDVPFSKALAGVRVGRDDSGFVVNPTYEELAESDIDLVLVGDREGIVMVEGSALEVSEEDMLEALAFGHEHIKTIVGAIEELVSLAGKEKRPSPELPDHSELLGKVAKIAEAKIKSAYADSNDKHELYGAIDAVKEEVVTTLSPEGDDDAPDAGLVKGLFKELESSILRKNVTQDNVRADGRTTTDIRPIDITVNNLPGTHGDALFTRGETQALVTATLGTGQDEQLMDVLEGEYKKKFYLHYNFPPFSVGETRRIMGPGRREIGHGMLAERALRAVLPDLEGFPYTIRIVSEILESNGSSSMASVCGGTLAMMDAGVPILAPVAGIAMGLIKEGDDFAILSDILGVEDHLGDMDFKVTGTENGITAFQLDLKIQGITQDIMAQALAQAKDGRLHILEKMAECLAEPRPEISPNAPKITQLTINREKIRDLIGPGGKVIRGIVEMTGAQIDVDDEGTVTIAAVDSESADQAIDMVRSITVDPEVGQQYTGRVTRLMRFGAFVEIMPGKEGMIHISDAADGHVDRIEDVFDVGDPVEVVVKEIDQQGRVNLHVFGVEPSPSGGGRGGGRGGRDDRGGRGGRDRGGRGGRDRDDRGGRGGRDRGGRERGGRDDRGGRGGRDRDDRGGRGGRDRGGRERDDSDTGGRRPRRSRDDEDNGGSRPRGGGREREDRGDRGGRGRGPRNRDDDNGGGRGGRSRERGDDDGRRSPGRGGRNRDNDDDGDRPPRREAGNTGNMDWYDRESRWDREERN